MTLRFWNQRLNIPDTFRIFLNTPVATEEAHAAHTGNALREPFVLIFICLIHEPVGLNVAIEIVTDKVIVTMVDNGVNESGKLVLVTECTRAYGIEDLLEVRVDGMLTVIVGVTEVFDVFSKVTKKEDV